MYKKKGELNHTALLFLSLNAEYFLLKGGFLLSIFFFFWCGSYFDTKHHALRQLSFLES